MGLFSMRDIFAVAIKIEERGEQFYRAVAEKVSEPKVRAFFARLAADEQRHRAIFQEMAAQLGNVELGTADKADFLAYLEAYTQNLIFEEETQLSYDAGKTFDARHAFLYAIEKELDSVLYYREVKDLVPVSEQALINEIIAEERRHVVNLSTMKQELEA